jgi:8-oxo-dGTP diphosphatase
VVAALIRDPKDRKRILVQQRLPTGGRANLWEFPGGKVEAGESDAQALARECREELTVKLAVGKFVCSGVHSYSDLVVELALYEAEILEGTPKPLHAQALAYRTVAEMRSMPFCEADIPLLEAIAPN